MKILGIDPGTERLGYALITERKDLICCGIIQTSKENSDSARLAEIRKDLLSLCEKYQPDIISVEKLFFFKNLKTIIPVAQARGVILEIAGTQKVPVYEYTPLQVKQVLTGHGRAEKSLVAEMVEQEVEIPVKVKYDDAIDAIAIALCYLRMDYLTQEAQIIVTP